MELTALDRRLLAALQDGLPLVSRPFQMIGDRLGMAEADVIARLRSLGEGGIIKRLGLVLRHHELGYRANAMTVWDVPDPRTEAIGKTLSALPFVTLCYRRPRRPPIWPYNLFAMIHGRDRSQVEAQIEQATAASGLQGMPRAVLFSKRRFKQRGARFD